jgi:hypothetical protein
MPDFGRWTSGGGDPSLNEINRVDRFFDALAGNETAYSTDHAEAELAFLMADWRDDVREAPAVGEATVRDAVAALEGGQQHRRSRSTLALVASTAAAVLCVGGFGAAVYGAGPGDALYGLHNTMFGSEPARDDQVVLSAQTEMIQVQQLIDKGQWQQAQDKLVALSPTVQSVDTPEQKQQLTQQFNALTYKVAEQDPAATLPPPDQPQPVISNSPLTLLPVPVVTNSDTSSPSTIPSSVVSVTPTSPSESPGPELNPTSSPSTEPTGPEGGPPSSPGSPVSVPPSGPSSIPSSAVSVPPSGPSSVPSVPASVPPSGPSSIPSSAVSVPPSSPVSVPPSGPASVPPSNPVADSPGSPVSVPASAPALAPPNVGASIPNSAAAGPPGAPQVAPQPPLDVTSVTPPQAAQPVITVPPQRLAPAQEPSMPIQQAPSFGGPGRSGGGFPQAPMTSAFPMPR